MLRRRGGVAAGVALFLALGLGSGAQACHLRAPLRPAEVPARVIGPSPPAETKRETEIGMRIVGGPVAPRFAPMPRILAEYADAEGRTHRIISAVTDGDIPPPGSSVVLRTRYIDPENDCQYIPWTVKPTHPAI